MASNIRFVDSLKVGAYQVQGSSGGGGGGTGSLDITNNINNYLLTATGTDTINGEANLQFDGSELKLIGDLNIAGNIIPNGSLRNLGSVANPFHEVFVTGDSIIFVSQSAAGTVTGSIAFVDDKLVFDPGTTGSIPASPVSILNNTSSYILTATGKDDSIEGNESVQIIGSGVLKLKDFAGALPTPVEGGIVYNSNNFYVGLG
tara:strand:- start:1409 stop:2017 length:609 start_codon:yes stop_codon:yes gene_type:complete